MTNLKKLVTWHTATYELFSEDGCLICLTEKERYLLGNALRQMRWNSRWVVDDGDTLPDIDAIASELDYKMSDDGCIDFCALVLDCIENNEDIQQAIASFAGSSGASLTDAPQQDILDKPIVQGFTGCTNDNMFGAITGLVDLLNDMATDIIQILNDNQNTVSRIAQIIEAIPVIGEVIPADLAEIVEGFFEDMQNLYDAAYTVALRDEYRCDLFCIAVNNNCTIDFDDVLDYYVSKMGIIFPTSIDQFFGLYVTGQYTGVTLVAAWHVMVIYLMTTGVKILGLNEDRLVKMISALYNDPDSDWSTLCDPCATTWTSTLDFTVSDYGITLELDDNNNPIGAYSSGVGFVPTCKVINSANSLQLYFNLPFDLSDVTGIEATGTFTRGEPGQTGLTATNIRLLYGSNTTGIGKQTLYSDWTLGVQESLDFTDIGNAPTNGNILQVSIRPELGACNGSAVVESITIRGEGTKPSQLP